MKCPATHTMPDGTVVTGKEHTAKSVVPTPKFMPKSKMLSIPKTIKKMP